MKKFILKNNYLNFAIFIFATFAAWWISINPFDPLVHLETKKVWSSFYWVFAALGGLFGVFTSKKLGFWRSTIGGAVLAFSIGLLLQVLGQIVDSVNLLSGHYYTLYPSISELGYSGSIIAYIYGAYLLARYVRVSPSPTSISRTTIVWGVSVFMFAITYLLYLKDYAFNPDNLLSAIFDFGYPVLESVYVALSIFVLVHSSSIGGGLLKKPIVFLVMALILQYVSDSYFVYEFNNNNWYSGNINDFSYLFAYFMLTLAIIYFDQVLVSLPVSGNSEGNYKDSSILRNSYNPHSDYEALVRLIIKSQEEVVGPLAWTVVNQVPSIQVKNKENMVLDIVGEPKQAIDSLLLKYFNIFGPISISVAKDKTKDIIKYMPEDMVPERLR